MDPTSITAETVQRHAFLLCLDVPKGTEVGIDLRMWTVGERFKGLKLIPPGPHLLYWSSVSKEKETGARASTWMHLRSGQANVLKWNPQHECFFSDREWPEEERARYTDGVLRMEFDASLGAYPLEMHSQWQSLTCLLTEPLAQKLAPVQGGTTSFFTSLPQKRDVPQGLKGEALTRFGLDKSQLLEQLIQQRYGNNANLVLGEMQYSFLTFLLGQDYDAFEQWKNLVALLCGCEKALETRATFFISFAETLHAQLQMVPEDFFIDPLSERNFLTVALKAFFELVQDPTTPANLASSARCLKQLAEQRFAVSFDVSQLGNEKDEDAPVVVDT